jgi:hypothetical protein
MLEIQGNSAEAKQMRKRLKDPRERKRVRAEQRAQIPDQYPDLAQALLLDPQKEAALIDLLTDQQMENLDHFYEVQSAGSPASRDRGFDIQAIADDETRRLKQLSDLLGPDGFERFRQYKETWGERRQAVYFDSRLDPDHKLSEDQKERLIALLHKQNEASRNRPSLDLLPAMVRPNDEALRRQQIKMEEDALRQMEQSSRELMKQLPEFLTPPQIDAYAKMETKTLDAQRKHVQQTRVSAGLSSEIPNTVELPANLEPPRKPVVGRIQFEMQVTANRSEPVEISTQMMNGETTSIEGPEGLWIEAKPTLYEDGWLDVDIAYYERGPDDRRVLLSKSRMGTRTRSDVRLAGGGGSTIVGSKGYAISELANANPIR